MVNNDGEIIPFVGIGKVKFGMTEQEVVEALGKPSAREIKKYIESGAGDVNLEYEDLCLEFSFSPDDNFRLGSITCSDERYTLFGQAYIGRHESYLQDDMVKLSLPDLELDDEFKGVNAKDYQSDRFGVYIWIQDGIIDSLTVFPKYDKSGTVVIWPE